MQHQRGEWVPIGEAADGPMLAIPPASPQARHHFTVADQVNQLVTASETDPDRGFMARLLALCSLPRTNPGNRKEYKRVKRTLHALHDCGRRQQAPLREYSPPVAGLGDDRGGTHSVPRVDPGFFAVRVHGQARHGFCRRCPDPPPQSDEAAL